MKSRVNKKITFASEVGLPNFGQDWRLDDNFFFA